MWDLHKLYQSKTCKFAIVKVRRTGINHCVKGLSGLNNCFHPSKATRHLTVRHNFKYLLIPVKRKIVMTIHSTIIMIAKASTLIIVPEQYYSHINTQYYYHNGNSQYCYHSTRTVLLSYQYTVLLS